MSSPFSFSSPEGFRLVRDTLVSALSFNPHDYQLEGVCKVLDGQDLVAVLPTGGGKTAYYTIYISMLLALSRSPELRARLSIDAPADPCLIMVYPTCGLEEEQVRTAHSEPGSDVHGYYRLLLSRGRGFVHS